jgi:acyl-CoA reductase-like NAD-dependent aldehyde dehydrogenase
VTIGPVQNRMQYEKVKGLLEDAVAQGRVLAGGQLPDRPGYFIPPTIIADLPDDARWCARNNSGRCCPCSNFRKWTTWSPAPTT